MQSSSVEKYRKYFLKHHLAIRAAWVVVNVLYAGLKSMLIDANSLANGSASSKYWTLFFVNVGAGFLDALLSGWAVFELAKKNSKKAVIIFIFAFISYLAPEVYILNTNLNLSSAAEAVIIFVASLSLVFFTHKFINDYRKSQAKK